METVKAPWNVKTSAEGAATGLFALMTGISEEGWHARWMHDLEFELWAAKPGDDYGRFRFNENHCNLLRLLSEEGGGWWHWPESEDDVVFVKLNEWKMIVEGRSR